MTKPDATDLPESSYPGMISGRSFDAEADVIRAPGSLDADAGGAFDDGHKAAVDLAEREANELLGIVSKQAEQSAEAQPPPPPKKVAHRKPLWVFIQVGPTADLDGTPFTPTYQAYECTGVEEVRKHLADHQVDAADISKRAIIFRADPVEVKIKSQLIIKF